MKTKMLVAPAAIAAMLLSVAPLRAQAFDPQCKSMNDKRGCTCALKYGGKISPDGKRWSYPSRSINDFAACRGGKA